MRIELASVAAIALATAAFAEDVEDARFSAMAEQVANASRAEIRAELEALGAHEWAGEYYAGDGLGVNTTLLLAPRSGYVFEWHGCLGLYDRNYGQVAPTGRNLRLSFTFDNVQEGFRGIAPEFTLVRWGARRYLVPADDVVGFCNEVNQGGEPRTAAHGLHLLRRGDESKKVSGSPELPPEYRTCLLASPVEARVSAVGAPALRSSIAEWKFRDTPVTLDAGSRQGLRIGMELIVIEPRELVDSVRITKVEAEHAEGTITQIDEDGPAPEVGWRISTRAPWNAGLTERVVNALRSIW